MAKRNYTDLIVIHCAATPASMDIGVQEIDRWHRQRGWLGCGYHFVIRRDGTIEKGRAVDAIGAHVRGKNSHSVGVCLVGGVAADAKTPEDNFTVAQFEATRTLLKDLLVKYPSASIVGHRDLNPHKACPCFPLAKVAI